MIDTQGIVINQIKYKETSIIAKIFTERLGLKSYVINNVRSKKPKYSPSLFYPLNILDMIVYDKKKYGLQYLSEIQDHLNLDQIKKDINKGITIIVIADLLDKTLKEDVKYENIYLFLKTKIIELNDSQEDNSYFLLKFFISLTKYFGFQISDSEEFDLQISNFNSKYKLNEDELNLLNSILSKTKFNNSNTSLNILLLKKLIIYYQLYIPSTNNIKSLKIFEELFN
ncbi:MAG: DNA repair protein RecO [Bacteroidetes bacterium]|nr:DNA repair protein RecO [Bacteroidota bacterium]